MSNEAVVWVSRDSSFLLLAIVLKNFRGGVEAYGKAVVVDHDVQSGDWTVPIQTGGMSPSSLHAVFDYCINDHVYFQIGYRMITDEEQKGLITPGKPFACGLYSVTHMNAGIVKNQKHVLATTFHLTDLVAEAI